MGEMNNIPIVNNEEPKQDGKATASMVLGIIGLVTSFVPFIGFPVNIVGLILGIVSRKAANKGKAKAGIIMSSIGIVLTIVIFIASLFLVSSFISNPITN